MNLEDKLHILSQEKENQSLITFFNRRIKSDFEWENEALKKFGLTSGEILSNIHPIINYALLPVLEDNNLMVCHREGISFVCVFASHFLDEADFFSVFKGLKPFHVLTEHDPPLRFLIDQYNFKKAFHKILSQRMLS